MTVRELVEKLERLSEDHKNLPVTFDCGCVELTEGPELIEVDDRSFVINLR